MFDIGATELLLVVIVALLVIGPKDLPLAMRTAGRWMGKVRGMTRHFRVGIDSMIREAEIEEQEKLWAERNEKIMREHPPEDAGSAGTDAKHGPPEAEPGDERGAELPPVPDPKIDARRAADDADDDSRGKTAS